MIFALAIKIWISLFSVADSHTLKLFDPPLSILVKEPRRLSDCESSGGSLFALCSFIDFRWALFIRPLLA